jgi:hypothetical protein
MIARKDGKAYESIDATAFFVFLQPRKQLLADLERRRAVGSAVLDLRPRQRDFSDVVEGHGCPRGAISINAPR